MERVKAYLKLIFKTPMVIVFILISIIYGGIALGKDAEIDDYAVVTAIGLDKGEEDVVEISLLTFVPIVTQNFSEQYEVVKSSGKSISEAMDFAGLHLGRQVGLSHVKMVVVNEDFFTNDATTEMDYLTRNANLALSTTLVCTDASAFDFLSAVKEFNTASSIKADDLVEFNEDYVYSTESTFETFYKGIYSPTNTELVSFITLTSENKEGISIQTAAQNSAGGGSGEGQSGQEEEKKKILNDGQAILCKDGREVYKLDKEEMKHLNFLKGDFKSGSIIIENFSDNVFTNAELTFEIFENKLNTQVAFENGIPVVYINSKIFLKLSEAKQTERLINENVDFKNISNEAIKAIEFKIKEYMQDGIRIMRENKADIINLYTTIYNKFPKEMSEFLDRLEDRDDFLNFVVFKVSPQIYSY